MDELRKFVSKVMPIIHLLLPIGCVFAAGGLFLAGMATRESPGSRDLSGPMIIAGSISLVAAAICIRQQK